MAEGLSGGQDDDEQSLADRLSVDECVEYIELTCECACSVSPPAAELRELISALCVSSVEPSKMLCQTLLRTNAMTAFLGEHMACRVRSHVAVELLSFPTFWEPDDVPHDVWIELHESRKELLHLRKH
eukprot:4370450-Karenia_brevis.AAC.1